MVDHEKFGKQARHVCHTRLPYEFTSTTIASFFAALNTIDMVCAATWLPRP